MLSPEDIRGRALTRYPDYLRSIVTGSVFFPLPIRFGKPSATEDFEKLRSEINALTKANLGCHIEWTDVNSRRWGKQRLPERVEFVDEASYLSALGKNKEITRFRENLALTRKVCPAVIPLIEARPLDVIEFADAWSGLLEVCKYFQSHPRPNLYARELPLSVDTKFIERYQPVLSRLLPACLPAEAVGNDERFEKRFGIRFDEPLIRFRLLDQTLNNTLQVLFSDIAIPLGSFYGLNWEKLEVIVSENKMTFLTLPPVKNGVGIWGAGNAAALLHGVNWLAKCKILYWGDIDIQGFEILSRLRNAFPHTRSLMMDADTFNSFTNFHVSGTPSNNQAPQNLTEAEFKVWSNVMLQNLRLEQERLPPSFIRQEIEKIKTTTQTAENNDN